MMSAPALLALLLAGTAPAGPTPGGAGSTAGGPVDLGPAATAPAGTGPGSTGPDATGSPGGARPGAPSGDRVAGDPCGAAGLAHLVGGPAPDGATLDAIRAGDGPPARVRVIRPGQPVTMDHFPSRLNILLDPSGTVLGLRCG